MKTINGLKLSYQKYLFLGFLCSFSITLLLTYLLIIRGSDNRVIIHFTRPQPRIIRFNMDTGNQFTEIKFEKAEKCQPRINTAEIPKGRIRKITPVSDELLLGNLNHIRILEFEPASLRPHNILPEKELNILHSESDVDNNSKIEDSLPEIYGIDYFFDFTKMPDGLTRLERIDWRKKNRPLTLIDFPHLSNEIPRGNEAIVIVSCIVDDRGYIVNNENGFEVLVETSPQYSLARSLIDKLVKVSDDGNIRPPLLDGKPVYSLFTFFWEINKKGISSFNIKHTAELKYK